MTQLQVIAICEIFNAAKMIFGKTEEKNV